MAGRRPFTFLAKSDEESQVESDPGCTECRDGHGPKHIIEAPSEIGSRTCLNLMRPLKPAWRFFRIKGS